MLNNNDKDFLDKLANMLIGYNDIFMNNTLEICTQRNDKLKSVQYDIYNRALKYFCSLGYELPTTLELLDRLFNFDKLNIVCILKVNNELSNLISLHNRTYPSKVRND
jgi:hypothetical protein